MREAVTDSRVLPETTRKWDSTKARLNVLQYFWHGFEFGKNVEIQLFFSRCHLLNWHFQTVLHVEACNDLGHGHTTPRLEQVFIERTIPFRKGFAPRHVMQGHRVGDGSVAVE